MNLGEEGGAHWAEWVVRGPENAAASFLMMDVDRPQLIAREEGRLGQATGHNASELVSTLGELSLDDAEVTSSGSPT